MSTQAVVLYHANCLDGYAAQHVAKKALQAKGYDVETIPVQHNQPSPEGLEGKEVYIVDFSYPREILEELETKVKFLVVLDPHKTAEEALQGLPYCVFDTTKSGCRLTWEAFHGDDTPPDYILDIEDRDLWKFTREATKPLCAYLYSNMDEPTFERVAVKLSYENYITFGIVLLKEFKKNIENIIRSKHTAILGGVPILACNANMKYASELGNQLAQAGPSGIACIYVFDGTIMQWKYSLRSVGDVDVSAIAKTFGGGGHKNAAGFVNDTLIFGNTV